MFDKQLKELSENINLRENLIYIKEALQGGNTEILKSEKRYGISLFPDLLDNPDAKVRKNAVLIMGMLGEDGYGDIIAKRYAEEKTFFVRSAYLSALKAYNYDGYSEMLKERRRELEEGGFDEADLKHAAAELKELIALLDSGKKQAKHTFTNPERAVRLILTTGADTREALRDALEQSGIGGVKPVFCGVSAVTSDVLKAAHIRIYKELLFPINGMKSYDKSEIPSALSEGSLMELLEAMHRDAQGAFSFRLDAKDEDAARLSAKIQALSRGRLINSVSDYEIEIKLIAARDGKYGLFLKLHTLGFDRFKYRENYVAASLSPVRAAMAVWLVRDYLEEGANVLNPFCGVGTMLIERDKLVKAGQMYGVDTFGKAVEGARSNTARAGLSANYINRDYFDFGHSMLFDEIITDMPSPERGGADKLYGRFLSHSEGLLKNRGIMIIYTSEKNLLRKHLRLNGGYKLLREFTIDSRSGAGVYVLIRQRDN
ncbi:MAG: methyltransferase [Butyrivibrio sp.]|nr:methyltransferase [Butyrivibrio sp.]